MAGSGFASACENHIGEPRVGADTRGIPEQLVFAFGGIAPGGLAILEALLNDALRFTEQNRNIFAHVEAITNEEGHHDDISRPGKLIALRDARFFVQEDGLDVGIKFPGADQFDLSIDCFAGILVLFGPVTGDEQGGVLRLRGAREWELLDDVAGAS